MHVCGHSLGGYLAARVAPKIDALSTLSLTPAGISVYNMNIVKVMRFKLAKMMGNYFWKKTYNLLMGKSTELNDYALPQ